VLEIESLIDNNEWEELRGGGKRLGDDVKQGLEGEVTLEELKKSLDSSNMSS
jgi:hypothetical protein